MFNKIDPISNYTFSKIDYQFLFSFLGMYATVPIMYVVLFILSLERLAKVCKCMGSCTKIFTNLCVTQVILIFIWSIGISIVAVFIYFKKRITKSVKDIPGKIIPKSFNFDFDNMFSSKQCSIDGQILPPFKILFLILFLILLILIIKSVAVTSMYSSIIPTCFGKNKNKKKSTDSTITLVFIIILLLNLVFSFPYYAISASTSIMRFIRSDQSFPMKLKITFILRLISIIFQSMVFLTLETNSWNILSKLLGYITCGKFDVLKVKRPPTKSKTLSTKSSRTSDNPKQNGKKLKPKIDDESIDNDLSLSDQTDDDVFLDEKKTKSKNTKKPKVTKKSTTDDDDDDVVVIDEKKTESKSAKKLKATKKSTTDDDDDDNVVFIDEKKSKSKCTKKPKATKKSTTDDDDDSDEEINAIITKKTIC